MGEVSKSHHLKLSPYASNCVDILDLSGELTESVCNASQTINAAGTVPPTAMVSLQSGSEIFLVEGFTADLGCTLSLEITPCN